jgi:hypothetical protein
MLMARRGFLPHAEIGSVLRSGVVARQPEAFTLRGAGNDWFDLAILNLERARDKFVEEAKSTGHCIETWHLGNLAYARLRSPALVPAFEEVLRLQTSLLRPKVAILEIDEWTFRRRAAMTDLDPDALYEHYLGVRQHLLADAESFGLCYRVIENTGSVEDLSRALRQFITPSL